MSYLDRLHQELICRRLPRRLRERILVEIDDHLSCDPGAELGDPSELAARFADELGTRLALRGALSAFAGLAVAGASFLVAFVALSDGGVFGGTLVNVIDHASRPWGQAGAVLSTLGCQVAFVCGGLAALRAIRRRGAAVLPGAETSVLVHRAAVGVTAGLITMGGVAMMALAVRHHLPPWGETASLLSAGVGSLALLLTLPRLVRSARLMPSVDGSAGDIYDDLGGWAPVRLRGRPWRLAITVAGVLALLIALAGALNADGYDGVARGIADAAACLTGFAVLGRYLGLRS